VRRPSSLGRPKRRGARRRCRPAVSPGDGQILADEGWPARSRSPS
jgi:hypothetical protein